MSRQKELNTAVWAAIEAARIGDNALGSLGMAYRWIETGKPIARQVQPGYISRDDLAEALVVILQTDENRERQKGALAEARARICEPYRQENTTGNPLLKPKESKKARAEA